MADESHTFGSTRARLEEIVTQVRKKDTSLEKSLDLLEEGVRLANACTELIDHQDWGIAPPQPSAVPGEAAVAGAASGAAPAIDASGEAASAIVATAEAAPAIDATAQATPTIDAPEAASAVDGLRDGAPDESFDAALSAWSDDDAPEGGDVPAAGEDPESDDSEAAQ